MDQIGQYILSVIAAAGICSIILRIAANNAKTGNIMKFLCGVFMICTAISPLLKLRIDDIDLWINHSNIDAQAAVNAGHDAAEKQIMHIIKERLETYISTKATQLNATVQAEVIMNAENPLLPESIRITGKLSPYARLRMMEYIANELGIPEDKQIWI